MDNKIVSFAKKNYQHGKNTAKNRNTTEYIENRCENKNRIIATLKNIGTHWNT